MSAFFRGFASIMNLRGRTGPAGFGASPDPAAVASDWWAVGADMRAAIARHRT